jgi:excisionase family DNA binding protein
MSLAMNPTENAVDVAGMAEILLCSEHTIYRLARGGAIPGVRVGRSWRFYPSEVKAKLSEPVDPWKLSTRSLAQLRKRG